MISFLAAFQFLTILPPIIRRAFTPAELGRAVSWFPLVGAALGGALYGVSLVLGYGFPASITAALILALWVFVTRGIHLDGFMDACDGLFGGFTPERRMEIMRDSRVGAFGAMGGALALLTLYVALTPILSAQPHAGIGAISSGVILAPILGRWVVALAVVGFPYARESGLGRAMKDHARWPQALIATLIAGAAAWLLGGVLGLIALAAAGVVLIAGAWFTMRRIPGLTGDIYGALCITTELVVLLIYASRIGLRFAR